MPKTAPGAKEAEQDAPALIAQHRRARFDYHILSTVEAGLVLTGTEVKALREGKANLTDAFGIVKDGELWVLNLHIGHYGLGNQFNHETTRTRKLLLHKKEIRRLIGAVERDGATLIPLDLHWRRGHAKLMLALAKGKKLHDKREDLKKKDADREIARVLRRGG